MSITSPLNLPTSDEAKVRKTRFRPGDGSLATAREPRGGGGGSRRVSPAPTSLGTHASSPGSFVANPFLGQTTDETPAAGRLMKMDQDPMRVSFFFMLEPPSYDN